jgi:hypothetical protein
MIEESFYLGTGSANLSYWASLDSSLNDSADDITNKPEVFFNINFSSVE